METKISNQRTFEVIYNDKKFFKYYLENYFKRLLDNNFLNQEQLLNIFIAFNQKANNFYPNDLLNFANSININFSKEGYRNYDFTDLNMQNYYFIPVKHKLIFQKIYSLLDCYRGLWRDLEIFEREAFLHIHLMRIYPFVYNNELICLLILISNLIKNYYPPIILNNNEKEDYYKAINSGDALKFKIIIEKKVEDEFLILIELYKKYYLFPDNISIESIILQKSHY